MSPTNRLVLARRRVGLSLGQAARNLNIAIGELTLLENGDAVSDLTAVLLSAFYGVSVEWLRGQVPITEGAGSPLDRECPTCGVPRNQACLGAKGAREPHPARVDPTNLHRIAQAKTDYSKRYYTEKIKPNRRRAR